MRIALHTVLRPGAGPTYDAVHEQIPADLMTLLTENGVRDWQIWRDGTDVFHLVEVDDYRAMREALRDHPVNEAWQKVVSPLFDRADSYAGTDSGITPVWRMSEQAREA